MKGGQLMSRAYGQACFCRAASAACRSLSRLASRRLWHCPDLSNQPFTHNTKNPGAAAPGGFFIDLIPRDQMVFLPLIGAQIRLFVR